MTGSGSKYVRLTVTDTEDIDEVVIAFRADGELVELASKEPPVEATLKKLDD